MIYIANSPYLIMTKAGYSESVFSLIFALNAMSLMVASVIVNLWLKK